jgi:hypothetical protein
MDADWVAGSVRARALARRRIGAARARQLARVWAALKTHLAKHRGHLDRTHPPGPGVLPATSPGPDADYRGSRGARPGCQGLRAERSAIRLDAA